MPSSPTRRFLKYGAWTLLVVIILIGSFYVYVFVRIVPPISAKLVDAVTGKPVQGMHVCLQVDADDFGHHEVLRQEISKSSKSGRIFFWPSIHSMRILETLEGYSIRVTDPQSDFAASCGPTLGPGLNEVFPGQALGEHVDTTRYFPVVLVRYGENSRMRSNNSRRPLNPSFSTRVALIPLVKDIAQCGQISDPSLATDCRELNADARATTAGSERARVIQFLKKHGEAEYWRNYLMPDAVPVRSPEDLFPAIVAGIPRDSPSMYDDGSYGTGRRAYECTYWRDGNVPASIVVQLEEFPNSQRAMKRLDELPGAWGDHTPTVIELFSPGQKIERHHGSRYSGAFWLSGNLVILIRFDQPFAKENEFIATFLANFPSSLGLPISK